MILTTLILIDYRKTPAAVVYIYVLKINVVKNLLQKNKHCVKTKSVFLVCVLILVGQTPDR